MGAILVKVARVEVLLVVNLAWPRRSKCRSHPSLLWYASHGQVVHTTKKQWGPLEEFWLQLRGEVRRNVLLP